MVLIPDRPPPSGPLWGARSEGKTRPLSLRIEGRGLGAGNRIINGDVKRPLQCRAVVSEWLPAGRVSKGGGVKNRLRELREQRGWTQTELGEKLGITRQSVHSIESGRYDPSLPLAFRIAELFKRRIEQIFEKAD